MKKLPAFTLGVEEEYQIIDPERDLRSHLSKIVDGASYIERTSKSRNVTIVKLVHICMNVNEAEKELKFLRTKIVELADKQGLIVGGAGTHPFQNGKTNRY
jgi:carboxylate-amine ligase